MVLIKVRVPDKLAVIAIDTNPKCSIRRAEISRATIGSQLQDTNTAQSRELAIIGEESGATTRQSGYKL
jgi:hypothetical protein